MTEANAASDDGEQNDNNLDVNVAENLETVNEVGSNTARWFKSMGGVAKKSLLAAGGVAAAFIASNAVAIAAIVVAAVAAAAAGAYLTYKHAC